MEIKDILATLMERRRINDNQLAKALKNKPPQSTINRILSGISKNPRKETVKPLADFFGITPGQLRGEEQLLDVRGLIQPGTRSNTFTIALMNARATGATNSGFPRPEEDQVIDRVTVHRRFLDAILPIITSPENLRVITAFGESMKPTLHPGDLLIVDIGIKQTDVDGIYVLSAKNELFIKRVRRKFDGSRVVISDNNPSGEPPEPLSGKHPVDIEGRVVWRWRGEAMA